MFNLKCYIFTFCTVSREYCTHVKHLISNGAFILNCSCVINCLSRIYFASLATFDELSSIVCDNRIVNWRFYIELFVRDKLLIQDLLSSLAICDELNSIVPDNSTQVRQTSEKCSCMINCLSKIHFPSLATCYELIVIVSDNCWK